MGTLKKVIKEIGIVAILFLLCIMYSIVLIGKVDFMIIASLVTLLSACVYFASLVVLYQSKENNIHSIYKYMSIGLASLGVVSTTYIFAAIGYGLDYTIIFKFGRIQLFNNLYEVFILLFTFQFYKNDFTIRKLSIGYVIITLIVIYLGSGLKLEILNQEFITGRSPIVFSVRMVTILGLIYIIKLVNKNKVQLTPKIVAYFYHYIVLRIVTDVFTIFTITLASTPRSYIILILRLISNYIIFRIMIHEVIKSPQEIIHNKLLRKSEHLEQTIQELKKRELEDEIKNELLANISHEFKTPVNVIYSAIQMQNVNGKDNNLEGVLKYTPVIKQNCFRLIRLINNFIDSIKLQQNHMVTNVKRENIVEIVENTTMSILSFAEDKNLSVVFDTDEEEIYTLVDSDLIERVMLNILSNAIKYNKVNGNIFVKVTVDDYVNIYVEDTGIGIPKEKLDIVFNRFERVDKSFSRHNEGSGLGLNIVKEIINIHNGFIHIESKIKVGTKVIIKLPIASDGNINSLHTENKNSNELNKDMDYKAELEMSDIYF